MVVVGFSGERKANGLETTMQRKMFPTPADAGDVRDYSSIPGSERSPGGGHGNPLQYSCPENPMDRGAQWATSIGLHRVGTTEVT